MNADCSVRQHNPRAESVEQHPDNRSGERPHHRAEQDRAGSQPAAPAKLFDDGDEKDRKCVARAKGYADGKKSDSDNDPGIIVLQDTAWGDLGFTYGHTVLRCSPSPLNNSGVTPLWRAYGDLICKLCFDNASISCLNEEFVIDRTFEEEIL
jgi:hypothetical protein